MQAPLEPVRWEDDHLRILDQRELPERLLYIRARDVETVADAIRTLAVRGAPAIGIAAAYGVLVGALAGRAIRVADSVRGGATGSGGSNPAAGAREAARAAADQLQTTRPTAVNLFYGLNRMRAVLAREQGSEAELLTALRAEADAVLDEDLKTGEAIAAAGFALFPDQDEVHVLTHCNAGGLATGGWGTALAPIYAAHRAGRKVHVFADETRPLLQGSRLTAWELKQAGVDVTVLVDGAAATLLTRGRVDLVIVGADRVAANGDTANKIGTLGVALAAREAKVPFYVAAPLSTFDFSLPGGDHIPIEQRAAEEVLGTRGAPGAAAFNPAFDVTPARFIHGWITEKGVLPPPFDEARSSR